MAAGRPRLKRLCPGYKAQKALTKLQAALDRGDQLLFESITDRESIDDRLHAIVALLVKLDRLAQVVQPAIDTHMPVSSRADVGEQVGILFGVDLEDRRADFDRRACRQRHQPV